MNGEPKEARLLLELVGDSRAPVELPRQGVMTIGLSKDKSDFPVEGQGIADVHCAIGRVKTGGWALKDLGSEYGTIVNGERVQSRKLEAGDLVLVGSRRLRILDADSLVKPKSAEPRPVASKPEPPKAEPARAEPVKTADSASKTLQVRGYRVDRPLGRGGMGEVYLAVQESLGRPVALKVLAAKLAADADFVRRFQAEARAAAALNHPNVVTVHDVWEDSGRHFLAMEFMDHGNLEQRVQRDGKLAPKEALEVLHDASKALVYAEMRGIVHRDIKPANLMQNSVGTTKLADLGLAMHLEAEATESDNKKIYGTPHFISPEQARGEKTDVRSDMYSLGATLYRLLSGRTPFEGATTRDILRGHFLEAPRPLAELAPDVQPQLAAIVHRLLEKKPEARYPSAAVLLQEVERLRSVGVLGGAPAPAAPKRSRTGTYVGLAIAAACLFGLYTMIRGGGKARRERDGEATNVTPVVSPDPNGRDPAQETTDPERGGQGQGPTRPRDDDTLLKLRETEAENALLRISSEIPPEERLTQLLDLVQRFEGTTAATKAQTEADRVRDDIDRARAVSNAQDQVSKQWLERLRAARTDANGERPLADAMRAMLAEEVPALLLTDRAVMDQRKALIADAVHQALNRARADLKLADEHEAAGRFEQLEAVLRPWLAALDLPQMPADLGIDQIPEIGDLQTMRGRVAERLDGLASTRESFARSIALADRKLLADELRSPGGVLDEARTLNFDALASRLDELANKLTSEDGRRFARELADGLAAGRRALAHLAEEFEKGAWKRKTFNDPRARSRSTRDAIGANAQGILTKSDAGADLVPWSAFGARPAELHQLFHQRLHREYTAEEIAGIESLVRLSAVLQTIDETSDMLGPTSSAVLSEEEARSIHEAFETARIWAALAGRDESLQREAEASDLLVSALRATTASSWSRAVATLERLMNDYGSTLLVRCLSDGRAP